ncbi:MAG: NAD-dependent epimerase/dehydratase family protein [Candidatus Saccharibacteria bacterium]|nr:NAD-dependent epimerase/dehydratase family protein [Rhodoferax sp.]
MRLAILGATSQIAKDLVLSFYAQSSHELVLYARRPEVVSQWLTSVGLAGRYAVADFVAFSTDEHFDAILNFVGVGNPAQAAAMGASIFDVTLKYDEMALGYLRQHPDCRYIFLSSGAAYGASFDEPANEKIKASVAINDLQPQAWYGVAKLHAECRHRSLANLPIVDIRVFNYFSRTQDIEARFLITDILRAIRDKTVLKTSADYIVRDFIHPSDFCSLVNSVLAAPATNAVVDAYSKAPIDKPTLLKAMQEKFGLEYEVVQAGASVNATGGKPHYYSRNTKAAEFGYIPMLTSLEGVLLEFSDVIRSILATVGDIVHPCFKLNPHIVAMSAGAAIPAFSTTDIGVSE